MSEPWLTGGLLVIMVLVLTLPFFSHRVEKQLELFLFLIGILSVTISGLWSRHLVREALLDPIKITLAIKSSEWARVGVPLGLALMIGCFVVLLLTQIRP